MLRNPRMAAAARGARAPRKPSAHAAARRRPAPATSARAACACGGGCPRCAGAVKVTLGVPGDAAERSADAIASRTLDPGALPPDAARAPLGAAAKPTAPPPFDLGAGAPLGPAERAFFEPRVGADLSRVRVHTGERAAAAAAQLGARAFAAGGHVVFGAGEYAPDTRAGRRLLAHELAHTLEKAADATTIRRQATDAGDAEMRERLRSALIALIPRVLHRIEQSVIRGYGGLYEFESHTAGGGILMGGPGTPEETLSQRRARLRELAADLGTMAEILARGAIPETWWTAAATRSSSGRAINIGGFGENVEALALMYQQHAEETGRDALVAFLNYGYIQPLAPAAAESRAVDTGIDVVAPDPDRPERVMRVFGATPILTDPETGRPHRSPIHRVHRDERGYYYLTGPAWLGPHRRVDLDPGALGITR